MDRLDPQGLRRRSFRAARLLGLLAAANVATWAWAAASFAGQPALLGMALVAWTFGLRHALDADHIAAIDNAVRRLVDDGRRRCVSAPGSRSAIPRSSSSHRCWSAWRRWAPGGCR